MIPASRYLSLELILRVFLSYFSSVDFDVVSAASLASFLTWLRHQNKGQGYEVWTTLLGHGLIHWNSHRMKSYSMAIPRGTTGILINLKSQLSSSKKSNALWHEYLHEIPSRALYPLSYSRIITLVVKNYLFSLRMSKTMPKYWSTTVSLISQQTLGRSFFCGRPQINFKTNRFISNNKCCLFSGNWVREIVEIVLYLNNSQMYFQVAEEAEHSHC